MTRPVSGTLTSRSPPGVHAYIRALGSRAHTSAVQPAGTRSVRRVAKDPPPLPAGTVRGTRVVAPALPVAARPTPGPPKRFAQAIGTVMTSAAVVVWATVGWGAAAWLVGLLAAAAFLEAAFGLCLGCRLFALGMRMGLVPEHVCEACADISRRPQALAP